MSSAEPHDWHTFDEEAGLDVRQVSVVGESNTWEVRDATGKITVLNDEEFDQLRSDGPNPRSL